MISPVFDTQIAAGCIGLKPQIGYADLVKTLLDVTLPKGQTRTDWSKRPLTAAQLEYAADDVLYLGEVAAMLDRRACARWGANTGCIEDCAVARGPAAVRARPRAGLEAAAQPNQLPAAARPRASSIAIWRERLARERDLPRGWIIPDAAIFTARARRIPRRARRSMRRSSLAASR